VPESEPKPSLTKQQAWPFFPALISPGEKREIIVNLIKTAKAVHHFVLQNTA